jgi:putative acetyltransferase
MKSAFVKNALVVAVNSPFEPEASTLLAQLRAELFEKYPDELEGKPFSPEQLAVPGAIFLLARIAGRVVGCGAIRPLEPGIAEVKRMFVVPEARRFGVGRKILQQLESAAGEMGYTSLRLETGLRQPEAIGLYESAGYRRVPCYGKYADNPMSVCFEKLPRQKTVNGER